MGDEYEDMLTEGVEWENVTTLPIGAHRAA